MILYTNIGDEPVTLTIGEIMAEANMRSLGTKVKPKINSIAKQVNPTRAHELWNKLKLEQNEFISSDSNSNPELFLLLN